MHDGMSVRKQRRSTLAGEHSCLDSSTPAGISSNTPDPTGGMFARGTDGTSLLGSMEETVLNAVRSRRPAFTGKLAAEAITGPAEVWASHGQTTAMEAGLGLGNDDIGIVLEAIDCASTRSRKCASTARSPVFSPRASFPAATRS
jgi:hypothetical protein